MLDLMRKIYLLSTLVLAILSGSKSYAQDFSNKGKEFWLAYCYHVGMVNAGSAPAMTLYITSDVATTYTVEIFGVTTLASGPIAANQVIPVTIPNTYFINGNGVFNNRTIRVTAAKPVVVYSFITRAQASAASLCLPTNVLGKEYYATSFTQLSNENNSSSYITIIAVEDNTNVEITPTATTTAGWLANSINTVTLNKGQIYQVLGITTGNIGVDLSGTKVRTIASTSGGCKKIAVFSGSGKISIGSPSCVGGSADNLYQQLYPVASWGKKFLTVPSSGRPFNHYRVLRSNSLTNVYVNGVLIPSASFTNNYYQFYNNTPNLITADIPITVAQFFTSQNCPTNQNPYDPDMIVLNPVEQNINKVTLVSSPLTTTGAHQHHLHVVIKKDVAGGTGQSSFRFDGAPVPLTSWVVHPQDATYSYLYLSNIAAGNHNLASDSGFNAVAYGYGNAETYGYSAGANVKDLYQQIGVASQYGIEPAPSVCKGSPFRFKVSLPYCADSMRWDISTLPGSPTQPPTQIYTTCTPGPGGPDSTTVVNGKTLYWYSLPTLYTFNTSGAFPVEIEVYAPNSDGCGNLQEIPFDLNIYDPPSADFTFVNSGCAAEPIQFTDNTTTPRPSYIWTWNFNDPASGASNTAASQNPSHTFSGPGTYNVTFSTVTTPGCFSAQIIKPVIIAPIPTATITGTNTVCLGDTPPLITFTVSGGTAPYTFTYNINGGVSQTISTTGTNTSVTIPVPTGAGANGTFRYNLEQVKNTGSTLCVTNYTNTFAEVIVNQTTSLTLSTGSNTQSVCENIAIVNTVYSISGGGNNATVTGLPPGVTGVYNAGTFTLSGAPTSIGTFNYTVTATGLCLPTSLTGTITVNPDAAISLSAGSNNQTVCISTAIATIGYTISGGGTGATITGLPAGLTGTYSGGIFTITGSPTVTGTFNYSVTTTGTCLQKVATGSITVNPDAVLTLSSAAGTTSQAVCINTALTDISYSISGGGSGAVVTGLPAGVTGTYTGGVFTINGTPSVAGIYNYSVTTTGICIQRTLTGTITVNPDAAISLSAGSNNQTVCISTAIATIGYTISGGGTGATITGLPAGLTGTYSGGIFTITGSPTVTGTFNYSVTTTGTCLQKVATGSITVNPDAVLTLSSAAGTTSQAVCINTALTDISYSISGGGSGAVVTGLPAGVTGTYTGGVFTINGTPSVAGIYNYSVTTTGICIQRTLTGTINVTPDAAIALTSAIGSNNQEFCVSSAISPITYSVSGGGTNGTVSGLPTGIAGVFSGGVFTISGTSTVSGTFNFTVTTMGTCIQKTATGTLIINELPTADFNLSVPTCETKLLNFTDLSVLNSGALTNWSWNFGDAGTSTSQNPTHTYTNAGTYTVSLSVTTNKGCTNIPVFTRQVTVNPQPVNGFISPEVCLSDTYAQFTDTTRISSGSIASWLWNFGDPGSGPLNTSVLQHPQHSYTAIGNYTATLTTTSNSGCVSTLSQTFTVNGDIPVSNFNALNPATMCANDSISIQDASTVNFGNVTKIEIYWDNIGAPTVFQTDDFPTPGKIYKHLYPNFQAPLTKTFSIRYRAYSGGTCINDRIKTIVVNAAPKVQFTNIPNACFDTAPFQLTQASEIGAVPGVGVFSGPGVTPAGIFNPSLVGPGTYTIKYTFTSATGGCVDTLSKSIKVYDTASANFTFSTQACERTAIAFNSTISTIPAASGTITGWGWDFGDPASGTTNISALQNPSHLFSSWGTYNVRLFVTTSNGCRSTVKTIPVFINPIPRPNFTTPASACLPSANVTFNNTSSIPDGTQSSFSYLWNFGDPSSGMLNTSTGSSPSHIYNTVGPFNVNLQVTSGAGCIRDTTIVLNTINPEPTGAFNIDKNDICVGQSFLLSDNSNPANGTTVQWNWNMGDGNVRTTQSFNYIYGTAGTFDITLYITNSNGCRSTSATRRVTVNPYPTVNAGPDLFILEDGSDTLEPIITAINPTYLWTPNNYFLSSNNIKNPVVKGVNDITYTLTVTGQGNCVSSDQVFIKVLKGPEIPNIFSPNGDGIHDTWVIKYLDTYPGGTVEVFNRYGQLIFRSVNYSVPWDGTINGKQVPMGTYYYIVDPKNGRKLMSGYVDIIR